MIKDYLTAPAWVLWIVFGLIAALSVLFLAGRGANLIAGFNTAGKKEQEQYDRKKMCRVVGTFLAVLALFILAMAILNAVLPVWFLYLFMGVTVVGGIVMIVLLNTVCRIKR